MVLPDFPEKWTKPLDDKIVTMCIDKTSHESGFQIRRQELAERILRVVRASWDRISAILLQRGGMTIECLEKRLCSAIRQQIICH